MQRLCPRFPRSPVPSRWHCHPRQKSLGNSGAIVEGLAPCHWLVVGTQGG